MGDESRVKPRSAEERIAAAAKRSESWRVDAAHVLRQGHAAAERALAEAERRLAPGGLAGGGLYVAGEKRTLVVGVKSVAVDLLDREFELEVTVATNELPEQQFRLVFDDTAWGLFREGDEERTPVDVEELFTELAHHCDPPRRA